MARGNQAADQAARRAALQNHDLIGIATLVPQTNLPETPSYTEGETLKAKSEGFQEDHVEWFHKEGAQQDHGFGSPPREHSPAAAWG